MRFKSNTNCCVPQCTAYHSKNPELSFHYFPQCDETKRKWIQVLRLGKKPGANARVCSRHFKNDSYKTAKPGAVLKRLVAGAIPDRNLPALSCANARTNFKDQKKARKQRVLQREGCGGSGALPTYDAQTEDSSSGAQGTSDSTEPMASMEMQVDEVGSAAAADTAGHDEQPCEENSEDPDTRFKVTVGVQVNMALKEALEGYRFIDQIKTDSDMRVVAGCETIAMFRGIVECAKLRCDPGRDVERDVIITMMKLKHDVSYSLLAVIFNLSVTTVASIFKSTITILSVVLSAALRWPSVDEVRENMPKCFDKFTKTRVVLDCTEFPIECSKCLRCRIHTYSNYKGQNTAKVMVGVSPAGLVTYISDAWGGKASDKAIFNGTKLIECIEPYVDGVMVDKGFHIEMELQERGIELFRPPFLRNKKQFSKAEAQATSEIAAAHVHVERVIGRLKQFKILSGKLQWGLLTYMDCIMKVVSAITNLSRPVLAPERFM